MLTAIRPLHPVQTVLPTTTTKSYTLKPRCITIVQPEKPAESLQQSNDIRQAVKTLEKMINREEHNLSSLPSPSPSTPSSSSFSSSSCSGFGTRPEKLGKRWMEYQGISNWEGLLDPLDENLRAEILRYGHFVEAAYKSFEFDPSSPSYATCRFPKSTLFERCGLPCTGYKVTKHLRATSGIQLPSWLDKDKAPSWVATQSSYIGYVAVCDDRKEIKRLGRRDVVVAYRGTSTCLEWLENLRATLSHLPFPVPCKSAFQNEMGPTGPMVESGFLSLYTSKSSSTSKMSLQQMVRQEIARILQTYGGEPLSLTITGHSLGAALATLTAYDVKTSFNRTPMVTVISFGGPRVGNRSFGQHLEKQGTKVLRIVNSDDVVTKVPGLVLDHEGDSGHVAKSYSVHVARLQKWVQKRVEDARWVYAEVGEELRLCSRNSPYLSGGHVGTCHELNTYLHLVDGFVSSECPFRATAKRFLRR